MSDDSKRETANLQGTTGGDASHAEGADGQLIQRFCDQFSEIWSRNDSADIAGFVGSLRSNVPRKLAYDLIEIDLEERRKRGLTGNASFYRQLFPDLEVERVERVCHAVDDATQNAGGLTQNGGELPTQNPGSIRSQPNKRLGQYKLVRQLGQGGMGTVWMAEQADPYRVVAIKLIQIERVRDDDQHRQLVARFEAERQALAMMNHPNIAKVFDGGTTPDGSPFFVMEYIRGVALTSYCDKKKLGIPARLRIFVDVCRAVHHAHQKGIIHRDLKPDNILVVEIDDQPVPKVIDFGLAKSLQSTAKLTDKTIVSEIGLPIGTWQYMSPEQAGSDGMDVDTRTDIYALGAILYELLSGSPPLDRPSLQGKMWNEMLAMIKDHEPPRPSERLSSGGIDRGTISSRRNVEPAKLHSELKGELDWVVLKSIEKERSRRYESANELAMEIERYLRHEPVTAKPPTAAYKVSKFVRKHRALVVTTALISGLLIAGIIGTSYGLFRASEALIKAETAQQNAERQTEIAKKRTNEAVQARNEAVLAKDEALRAKNAAEDQRNTNQAILEFFEKDLLSFANPWDMYDIPGANRRDVTIRTVLEQAAKKFSPEKFSDSKMSTEAYLAILITIADIFEGLREFDKAESYAVGAYKIAVDEFGAKHPKSIELNTNQVFVKLLQLKTAESVNHGIDIFHVLKKHLESAQREDATPEQKQLMRKAFRSWLATVKRRIDYAARTLPTQKGNPLSGDLYTQARLVQFRLLLPEFAERVEREFGPDDDITIYCNLMRGFVEFFLNKNSAKEIFEEGYAIALERVEEGVMSEDDVAIMGLRQVLATIYNDLGIREAEQIRLAKLVNQSMDRRFGESHPGTLLSLAFIGETLMGNDRPNDAAPYFRQCVEVYDMELGPLHERTAAVVRHLTRSLWLSGDAESAFRILDERLELFEQDPTNEKTGISLVATVYYLGQFMMKSEKYAEAVTYFGRIYQLESNLYPEHWRTFDTQSNLGAAQSKNGQGDLALSNLVSAAEGLEKVRQTIPPNEKNIYRDALRRLMAHLRSIDDDAALQKWQKKLNEL